MVQNQLHDDLRLYSAQAGKKNRGDEVPESYPDPAANRLSIGYENLQRNPVPLQIGSYAEWEYFVAQDYLYFQSYWVDICPVNVLHSILNFFVRLTRFVTITPFYALSFLRYCDLFTLFRLVFSRKNFLAL